MGYGLDDPGLITSRAIFLSSPQCPDQLWGTPNLLYNGYWGLFLWVKRLGRETDHWPQSSAKVKNCGIMPLFHCMSSWYSD
jgi:hypothetical protein